MKVVNLIDRRKETIGENKVIPKLGRYDPTISDRLGFKLLDLTILTWFTNFLKYGQMKKLEIPDLERCFYWVDMDTVKDFSCSNIKTVRKAFDRLCGKGFTNKNLFPLEKKIIHTPGGKRCYFAIREGALRNLEYKAGKQMTLLETPKKALNKKKQPKGSGKVTSEQLAFLKGVFSFRLNGKTSPIIFNHQLPEKYNGKYTKTLIRISERLYALYEGRYKQNYFMDPKKLKRYGDLITEETWKELRAVKGSWEKVFALVEKAIRNYRLWFRENYEPVNKKYLIQEFDKWMYDNFDESSLFIACITRPPYKAKEFVTDKIYDSLPDKIKDRAVCLLDDNWDQFKFWSKIKGVYNWFRENKKRLEDGNSDMGRWLSRGVYHCFSEYLDYLQEYENIYLSHIGINCPTWEAWLRHAKKNNY